MAEPACLAVRLWQVRRPLLLFGPPLWLAISALGFYLHGRVQEAALAPVLAQHEAMLLRAEQVISRSLAGLRRDLRFLALSDEQATALHGGDSSGLLNLYRHFLSSAETYSSVRWISAKGRELARVDMLGDPPQPVVPQVLQDKSDRPYFFETMKLPAGATYNSPLELNQEFGRIELPFNPTVRVALPLFAADKRAGGVLVLNYRAEVLLGRLREVVNQTPARIHLLDKQGFWLLSPTPEQAWGFMTGRPADTLARQQPELWERMLLTQTGHADTGAGLWSYRKISVREEVVGKPAQDYRPTEHWYVLIETSAAETAPQAQAIRRWSIALTLLAGLIASLVLARLSLTEADRQAAWRALQLSKERLDRSLQQLTLTQATLVRKETLAALGMTVAGVAHELSTPLGSVLITQGSLRQKLQQLAARLAAGTLTRHDLDEHLRTFEEGMQLSDRALERAAGVVNTLKQLAVDRATAEQRQFRLREVLAASVQMHKTTRAVATLTVELDVPEQLEMLSYPGPLGQVISNCLNNASMHAYPNRPPGHVLIRARASADQASVEITVRDDGEGMGAEVLAQAFTPFFSTKRSGGGTGLGMGIVHQLVTEVMAGEMQLHSAPGEGTTVTLRLPRLHPGSDRTLP